MQSQPEGDHLVRLNVGIPSCLPPILAFCDNHRKHLRQRKTQQRKGYIQYTSLSLDRSPAATLLLFHTIHGLNCRDKRLGWRNFCIFICVLDILADTSFLLGHQSRGLVSEVQRLVVRYTQAAWRPQIRARMRGKSQRQLPCLNLKKAAVLTETPELQADTPGPPSTPAR
jgi:hypothetical protein